MCNQRQARKKEHDQFVTGFDFIIIIFIKLVKPVRHYTNFVSDWLGW